MAVLDLFSPATRAWFSEGFEAPTPAQEAGWPVIASGAHTLIHAPTGSGKTLAAFLWTLDRLMAEPVPERGARCRVLYVSPLKALAYDIDRNLRAPLAGIRQAASRLDLDPPPEITTFLRTGDTPAEDRRRMQSHPPDILITTPESLYLILTSAARAALASVRWVIVDEIHAVAGSKRGAHLALSLERLEELADSPQRIGLSATQRPLTTIAGFLGGPRPVEIVDAAARRDLDLELIVPVEDMAAPVAPDPLNPDAFDTRSIWPAVHPRILELVEAHTSTIVFANSRRLAERLCADLNELAGKELARAHHGSVSREHRLEIEDALKRGELKAVVATSSLELGIDMGAVDLVIQVEAPVSVASGLQRVGRAGHQVGATSRAKLFPKYRGDLLVATVVASLMTEGAVEPTAIPRNPLDVLAQQIVAAVVVEDRNADDLYAQVRRAAPYAELSRAVFDATLDMLAGRYPSDLFAELRPRVNWDRVTGMVSSRPGARQLAVTNPGTIPDRGMYRVVLPDGSRVGELDEEMVYESRQGDVFLLGSSSWRITDIGVDRVEVIPAPGAPGAKLPFWHGDSLGRSLATGRAIGEFVRTVGALAPEAAHQELSTRYHLDHLAAANLIAYLADEVEATGVLPTDRNLVIERFRDEIGDWRVVILSPFGARIHAPWALALTQRLRGRYGSDVDVIWSDDGIAFRFSDADEPPDLADLSLDPDEVDALLVDHLADTALFAARFREAAGRSLLLPRRRPGARTPLWLQRRRAAGLLSVAKEFGTFPIVLETYREILQDDFDVPSLGEVLAAIQQRRIRMTPVDLSGPSPFASSLLFAFIAAYLYEPDAPLAERRAAALTLDRDLLAELLGESEIRELLSADVMAALELELQHLTPETMAGSVDQVADMLADLGPLTVDEITQRVDEVDVDAALAELASTHRALQVRIGSNPQWAAAHDASRLRDGLGAALPQGVPVDLLEPVPDPLGDLVGRYARTHGPFTTFAVSDRLSLAPAVCQEVLARLESEGRVTRGRFTSEADVEWLDTNVLRRIKRRSLAVLRGEIEPVAPAALGRFLPAWHGIGDGRRGRAATTETIHRLQGAVIPASVLERDVISARLTDGPTFLDQLMIEGEVLWVGRGPLGPKDGKVSLFFREQFPLLGPEPDDSPLEDPIAEAILQHLRQQGASFFAEIYAAAGGGDPGAVSEALWDLVWRGLATNDTLAPLRAYVDRRRSRRGSPTTFPPHTAGRWSAVTRSAAASPTERATAWAAQLLDRHGVITRSVASGEGISGGFTGLYPVLNRMEETGRVRRGYFIEGQGGAQFATPGSVDRLRAPTGPEDRILAATDPANPYGAALPWPTSPARLARLPGRYVILVDGELSGFVEAGGRSIYLWGAWEPRRDQIVAALGRVADSQRRFAIQSINGDAAAQHPLASALTDSGFVTGHRGLSWKGLAARTTSIR